MYVGLGFYLLQHHAVACFCLYDCNLFQNLEANLETNATVELSLTNDLKKPRIDKGVWQGASEANARTEASMFISLPFMGRGRR